MLWIGIRNGEGDYYPLNSWKYVIMTSHRVILSLEKTFYGTDGRLWMKSVKCFVRRDVVVRPHKSDALLHRINHDESRILGSAMWKSLFLPDRLVQSETRRAHTHGRRRPTYVSIFNSSNLLNEATKTKMINLQRVIEVVPAFNCAFAKLPIAY